MVVLQLIFSHFISPAPESRLVVESSNGDGRSRLPQSFMLLSELGNFSRVSREWMRSVLEVLIVRHVLPGPGGKACVEFSQSLNRCLCWFDSDGLQRRTVTLRRTKNRSEVDLVEVWRGWQDARDVFSFFGFSNAFVRALEAEFQASFSRKDADADADAVATHRAANMVIGSTAAFPSAPLDEPQLLLNRQSQRPVVQFLNCDSSCSVTLKTNEFECGEVQQPVTIFLVGIALEDGCFLSGLKSSFEVGHLYPDSKLEAMVDCSSLRLCASKQQRRKGSGSLVLESMKAFSSQSDDDTSDSSEYYSDDSDSIAPPVKSLKGTTKPGSWHLYTCVFDGEHSRIRVDGMEDLVTGDAGAGTLDGLTFGSDHYFRMSLCDGGALAIDGQQGGGAIAEVGLFEGLLQDDDILFVEEKLMKKHKLERRTELKQQEDTWALHAHCLIAQPSPWLLKKTVPLKFAARERSVVWSKKDPITGDKVRVSRIGTNKTGSDSDW